MRPEGKDGMTWEQSRHLDLAGTTNITLTTEQIELYEAGADAILKALCTDDNRLDCIDQYGTEPPKNVEGWLVFIPEDKD